MWWRARWCASHDACAAACGRRGQTQGHMKKLQTELSHAKEDLDSAQNDAATALKQAHAQVDAESRRLRWTTEVKRASEAKSKAAAALAQVDVLTQAVQRLGLQVQEAKYAARLLHPPCIVLTCRPTRVVVGCLPQGQGTAC